jgi:hypothetical protein
MGLSLNMVSSSVQGAVLRKDSRIFGLLGKATPTGVTAFSRSDVTRSWALTSEFGWLRLERLTGEEQLTGDQMVLPSAFSYEYGIVGLNQSAEMTRAVFGLLPAELEALVSMLRRGSFTVLGFSHADLRCSISGSVIPGHWPHVVTSNVALYGNVISLETFVRIIVSSLPQGQLGRRYPALQPVFTQVMKLMVRSRPGLAFSNEMLGVAPASVLAVK